jgi:hypothetical protein
MVQSAIAMKVPTDVLDRFTIGSHLYLCVQYYCLVWRRGIERWDEGYFHPRLHEVFHIYSEREKGSKEPTPRRFYVKI